VGIRGEGRQGDREESEGARERVRDGEKWKEMVKGEILEFVSWNLGLGICKLGLTFWNNNKKPGYFNFLQAINPAASSAVSTGAMQNVPEQT
jgi:hypothetical protein